MTTITLRGKEYKVNKNITLYDFTPYIKYFSLINKDLVFSSVDKTANELLEGNLNILEPKVIRYVARKIRKMIVDLPLELVDSNIDEGINLHPKELLAIYEGIAETLRDDPNYQDEEIEVDEPIIVEQSKEETIKELKEKLASLEA